MFVSAIFCRIFLPIEPLYNELDRFSYSVGKPSIGSASKYEYNT
jgi:hypothetical protein